MKKIDKNEIIEITGLADRKIRNIYMYGSRVYGTYGVDSDYDIMVTACSMLVDKEFYEGEYNIHVTTPDIFEDRLRKHDIHAIECVYAPDFAQIQITKDYREDFVLNPRQLKKMLLSQSSDAWRKAMMRIDDENYVGGEKTLFHSLRILKFGIQIIENGKLTDFSEANYLKEQIDMFSETADFDFSWASYKHAWYPVRKKLQKEFRSLDEGMGNRPFDVLDEILEKVENKS